MKLDITVIGLGVVGSGVCEVVDTNRALISSRTGVDIDVKYIVDIRDCEDSPYRPQLVKDFVVVLSDPDVKIVVEAIGGTRAAYEYSRKALASGRHVVTSNKELVAEKGYELNQLAKANKVSYLFEASVGGGIPIIRPLTRCLGANEISSIYGILNGTTNYILSKMTNDKAGYADVLKEAQRLGYAEADPTDDVSGKDTLRKICILSSLAYGSHIYPGAAACEGIEDINPEDIECALACGYKLKLLGLSKKRADGRVSLLTAPHLVSQALPIYGVDDVFNGIVVNGNAVGEAMFYGRGAGKLPTASAVWADILDIAAHLDNPPRYEWEDERPDLLVAEAEHTSRWFVRLGAGAAVPAGLERTACACAGISGEMTRVALDKLLSGADVKSVLRVL